MNDVRSPQASGYLPRSSEVDWYALRAPFDDRLITQVNKGFGLVDTVNHAAVIDRLLQVAPTFTYEFTRWIETTGKDGMPHLLAVVGWMQIGGVRRFEVGEVERPSAYGDECKKAISDFIKRAAMRFGVGLDLWSKEELSVGESTAIGAAPAEYSSSAALPAGRPQAGTISAPSIAEPASPTSSSASQRRHELGGRAERWDADPSSGPEVAKAAGGPAATLGPGASSEAGRVEGKARPASEHSSGAGGADGTGGPPSPAPDPLRPDASHEDLFAYALRLVGTKEHRLRGYVNTFCKTRYTAQNFDEVSTTQLRQTIAGLHTLLETGSSPADLSRG